MDLNQRPSDEKPGVLPTELTGHAARTRKNMYLTVKASSRKNVNIKQEKCQYEVARWGT